MAKGGDWGFVGDAYEAPALYQDAEKCVNWYVETAQRRTAKVPVALLGSPGLTAPLITIGIGPIRGAWVLPGSAQALVASGNALYLVTAPGGVWTGLKVGTLASNTGPVVIRDGGASGFAWIVDGPNGYLYTIATQAFKQISDPGFLGSDRVAFVDGWMIFNWPGTQTFYVAPQYGSLPFNGSFFALKDGATDKLVTFYEDKREVWFIGESTSEVWYDAGGQFFPLARLQGAMLQIGCQAKHSIARFDAAGNEGLIWLGSSERGQNVVVRTKGYQHETVSTRAVEDAIASYAVTSDAVGYTYQEDGHEFYMLTFPTADVTWCYDGTEDRWHQRLSFDPATGLFHRHRSTCCVNFQGLRIVGDYQNGNLYAFNRQTYSDNGAPLIAWRRTPHVWDGGARRRIRHRSLQLDFRMGVGSLSVPNPQAMIRWSDDSGVTYGNQRFESLGKVGETRGRVFTRRLGSPPIGHSRVYDVQVFDAVGRDVVGATLDAG